LSTNILPPPIKKGPLKSDSVYKKDASTAFDNVGNANISTTMVIIILRGFFLSPLVPIRSPEGSGSWCREINTLSSAARPSS
jgi:hypothetical protein